MVPNRGGICGKQKGGAAHEDALKRSDTMVFGHPTTGELVARRSPAQANRACQRCLANIRGERGRHQGRLCGEKVEGIGILGDWDILVLWMPANGA